jgi:four helix bundle protein
MDRKELEERTKGFALRVVRFVAELPKTRTADVLGHQLLRSGTSIGANYREAARAESRNDFVHKIALVEKEAAETEYWLELMDGSNIGDVAERHWLQDEARQLLAIFTASGRTAKANRGDSKSAPRKARGTGAIRNPDNAPSDSIRHSETCP